LLAHKQKAKGTFVLDALIKWYFEIPTGPQSERLSWSLRAVPLPVVEWIGPMIAVAAVLIAVLTWFTTRSRSLKTRVGFMVLRTTTFLVILGMLLQLTLQLTYRGKPLLVLAIDTSASMSSVDELSDQQRATTSSDGDNADQVRRLERIQLALTANDSHSLQRLRTAYRVELAEFDSSFQLIDYNGTPSGESDSREISLQNAIEALTADGPDTDLSRSIQNLFAEYRGNLPASVILLTDGNATSTPTGKLSQQAALFRERGVDLTIIGVGQPQSNADVRIDSVNAYSVAFAGDDGIIDVELSSDVHIDQPITLQLQRGEEIIDEQEITLTALQQSTSLIAPQLSPGRNNFEVSITPLPGEVELLDNQRSISIWGREALLQVLMVDRLPNWEFFHLKQLLERDPHVQLSTWLQSSDAEYALEDQTALTKLPTQDGEFAAYDLIIWGDVDATQLDPRWMASLLSHLEKTGAGLLWLGDGTHAPQPYLSSPVSVLVPLQSSLNDGMEPAEVQFEPAIDGVDHPLFRFRDLSVQWSELPPLFPKTNAVNLKPGVLTFAQGRRVDAPGETVPLMVSMRYGNAPILWTRFSDSWAWKPAFDGNFYRTFWQQVVRFLAQHRMQSERPAIELTVDREQFERDEQVTIKLSMSTVSDQTTPPPLFVIDPDGLPKRLSWTPTTRADEFITQVASTKIGTHLASLEGTEQASTRVSARWEVIDVDPETKYRPMNQADLKLAAESANGRFLPIREWETALSQLPKQQIGSDWKARRIPLWCRWEYLSIVFTLLTLDWLLCRRTGVA